MLKLLLSSIEMSITAKPLTNYLMLYCTQAFECVKATAGDLRGDLKIITKDLYDAALSIAKNNFLADEPLGR